MGTKDVPSGGTIPYFAELRRVVLINLDIRTKTTHNKEKKQHGWIQGAANAVYDRYECPHSDSSAKVIFSSLILLALISNVQQTVRKTVQGKEK